MQYDICTSCMAQQSKKLETLNLGTWCDELNGHYAAVGHFK